MHIHIFAVIFKIPCHISYPRHIQYFAFAFKSHPTMKKSGPSQIFWGFYTKIKKWAFLRRSEEFNIANIKILATLKFRNNLLASV